MLDGRHADCLRHATLVPQRSWRTYTTNKKEEKARLDALVSPDVQARGEKG